MMKLSFAIIALATGTFAKVFETDILAQRGLENLWDDVAKNPQNYDKSCNKDTVAKRREWYVFYNNATDYHLLTY